MNLSLPNWLHDWLHWHGALNERAATVPRVRWSALRCACQSLRNGRLDDVRTLMTRESDLVPNDAPCLNLLGVLALADGDWHKAVRFWKRAVHADHSYTPARRNLRRYFELFQFGRSDIPIALGDEPECLAHQWDEP
jgi:hypothetical protein